MRDSPLAGTFCSMARTAAHHPISTASLIEALDRELRRIPSSVPGLANREKALAATAEWKLERMVSMAIVLNSIEVADRASMYADRSGSAPRPAAATSDRHTMAYDPATNLVWGVGSNISECMAHAGWALVESGRAALMAHLRFKRSTPGFAASYHEYGAEMPWALNMAGQAAPAAGYEVPAIPAVRVVAIPIHAPGHA